MTRTRGGTKSDAAHTSFRGETEAVSLDAAPTPGGGEKRALMRHMPSPDMLAKGVATGVAVSAITQTGRKIMSVLVRNPVVMFGVGFAAGFFVHKYRKEIIAAASSAADQSRDFVLRQKENLEDLLAESKEEADEAGSAN